MTDSPLYHQQPILQYDCGARTSKTALVVREAPLTIYLNDHELTTLVCSPLAFEELTIGFLFSEGLLKSYAEIAEMTLRTAEGIVWVQTKTPLPQAQDFLRRNLASCCGKGRSGLFYVNDTRQLEPAQSPARFSVPELLKLMDRLNHSSDAFRRTGGVHSAGLGQKQNLLFSYDDIGRHNAVDKVLGRMLLEEMNTADKCIVLTGRVASEILIKAARAGTPLILSRSAPTVLAVELARELGITLAGFARGEQMNIYCGAKRLIST